MTVSALVQPLVSPLVRGIAEGLGDPFVFHGLDMDIATKEMRGVLKGIGGLTEARTSTIYQRDWEDIWRSWGSGEPAWFGGRKVENLIARSTWAGGIPPTGWSTLGGGTAAVADGTVDGNTKVKFSNTAERYWLYKITESLVANSKYIFSIVVDDIVDGALVLNQVLTAISLPSGATISYPQGSTTLLSTLGVGARVIVEIDIAATAGTIRVRAGLGVSSNATGEYTLSRPQLENVTGQADQTPSEYIPTTTVAAHKIFGTDRSGVPLASLPWLYGGPAGTNSQIQSDDQTNVEWTAVTMTAAKDAAGMRGEANGACTLTATAANATVIANIITAASDDQTTRWSIKRKTGVGVVEITVDGGTTWQDVTTEVDSTTGFNEAIESLAALANPQIGIRIVTSGDAVIVGNAEAHTAKTQTQVRGSTPIFTAGSTVTVNASDPSFDDANHDDTEGAYFVEFKNVGLNAANLGGLVGLGTSARVLYTATAAVSIRAFDGTALTQGPTDLTLAADDTEYKIGLAYGSSLYRINTDADWGSAGSYDGVFDNAISKLAVLRDEDLTAAANSVMLMRNLRRYDLPYVAAQTKIGELMI